MHVIKPKSGSGGASGDSTSDASERQVADPQAIRQQFHAFRRNQIQVVQQSLAALEAERQTLQQQYETAMAQIDEQVAQFEAVLGELSGSAEGQELGEAAAIAEEEQIKAEARRIVHELRSRNGWIPYADLAQLTRDGQVDQALSTFSHDDFEVRGRGQNAEYRWVGL